MAITGQVTVADLEVRLGRTLGDSESARASADIDDTYALAEAHGLLAEPPTSGQLVTVARVALRAFRNPDGIRQESLGSRSVTYADDSRPGVYFTSSDVVAMRGADRASVYSVKLVTPADRVP